MINDLLKTTDVAKILKCSESTLYQWRTSWNFKQPEHIQIGNIHGRIRYTKSGLFEFLKKCSQPSDTFPLTIDELIPMLTTQEVASLLKLKRNTIEHNRSLLGIPHMRIHPLGRLSTKHQGFIRYSQWHINQLIQPMSQSPYSREEFSHLSNITNGSF